MDYVTLIGTATGVDTIRSQSANSAVSIAQSALNDGSAINGVMVAEYEDDNYKVLFKWPGRNGYHLTIQDLP